MNKRPRIVDREQWFDKIPQNGSKKLMVYRKLGAKKYEYYHPEKQVFDDGTLETFYHRAFNRELREQEFLILNVEQLADLKRPLSEIWIEVMEANEIIKRDTYRKTKLAKYPDYCVDFTVTGLMKATVLKHLMSNSAWFKKMPDFKEVKRNEFDLLENASQGGITWCEPFEGLVHMIDIDSMYPSIYGNDPNFMYPMTCSINVIEIDEFPEEIKYGIYTNVKLIFPEATHKIAKMALVNQNGVYTHYRLRLAKMLNCKIVKMKPEKKIQFQEYITSDLLDGSFLFDYVKALKRIKTYSPNKMARKLEKQMLNCLWGILSEKKKDVCVHNGYTQVLADKKFYDFDYDYFGVKDATELEVNWMPHPETGEFVVTSIWRKEKGYQGPIPRIKPFLLDYARCKMIKHALCFDEDDIVRIHTDSFWLKKDYGISLKKNGGGDIGLLKYEGHNYVSLKSLNVFSQSEQPPCQ